MKLSFDKNTGGGECPDAALYRRIKDIDKRHIEYVFICEIIDLHKGHVNYVLYSLLE